MQASWRDRLLRPVRVRLMNMVADAVAPLLAQQEQQFAELRAETRRVYDRLIEFEIRTRRDIVYAADRQATLESAEFVRANMPTAPRFDDPHRTLEHALSLAPTGGMALEFGVYTGSTLKIIAAARTSGGVYGFDAFQGLPEDWRIDFPAGTFSVDGRPDVAGAELVVGWFADTLPEFLARHPEPVDFIHVDADLYSSAKTVLDLVGPRLRPGSVLVFDEFFNFPGWQEHECRALQEYVERTGVSVSYEGYCYANEQVIVRITR
ncbi:class I SAM-dependent methyltransferase [Amycolatopsis sp. NBC_01488]|uniref:class I SAM-dependent methyltransferase n=1 Tax=Amycolatopsis sp. NBC_01488 TaxID=2903563 RepID=UPI002E2A0FD1|nr:class I SAM-dependent methyltransferase [Amycolatopsis sp. NBC_01488]